MWWPLSALQSFAQGPLGRLGHVSNWKTCQMFTHVDEYQYPSWITMMIQWSFRIQYISCKETYKYDTHTSYIRLTYMSYIYVFRFYGHGVVHTSDARRSPSCFGVPPWSHVAVGPPVPVLTLPPSWWHSRWPGAGATRAARRWGPGQALLVSPEEVTRWLTPWRTMVTIQLLMVINHGDLPRWLTKVINHGD